MKLEAKTVTLPRAAAPKSNTIHGKPERMAWVVLFGAFGVCIALTLLVPIAGFQFFRFATVAQTTSIQAAPVRADQVSPVRVTLPNVALPIAVIAPTEINENSRVETDTTDNSRAFLTFFDHSTAFLYQNSQITLGEMRQPQFGSSEQPNSVVIEQNRGLVRYGVAAPFALGNPNPRATLFLVRTPQLNVWLNAGSYAFTVTDTGSQLSVREGSAIVVSKDGSRQVVLTQGQRIVYDTRVAISERDPFTPLPAAQDLIANGDFSRDLDCSPNTDTPWRCYTDQGGDGGDVNGSIGVVTKGDRLAVQIKREGSNQNSAITGIRQMLDRDVSDFRSLTLSADVRIDSHNLSGGGYLSSEYPLLIRIRYRDVNGEESEYVRGFYIQNDTHNPTNNGELEPQGQWIPIDSSNLLALPIKPFRIIAIEIYASGWDYESYVSNVQLKAE